MQELEVTVDYNGIVLFDPELLIKYYAGKIAPGTNLYKRFTETNDGDDVIRLGIVVPILSINDGIYRIVVRQQSEQSHVDSLVIHQNGVYPLHVQSRLIIADMAVLAEWEDELGWQAVNIHPGYYSTVVRGFRKIERERVTDFGYEFVLSPETALPKMSASIDRDMQVLTLTGNSHTLIAG